MIRNCRHALWATAFALLASSCDDQPPFVNLRLEDPNEIATEAVGLFVGADANNMEVVKLERKLTFPFHVVVEDVVSTIGEKEIIVEARNVDGIPIARGQVVAKFRRKDLPSVTVALAKLCTTNEECLDATFCDGTGSCKDGVCVQRAVLFGFPVRCQRVHRDRIELQRDGESLRLPRWFLL